MTAAPGDLLVFVDEFRCASCGGLVDEVRPHVCASVDERIRKRATAMRRSRTVH